ncbi:YbjN domain-containing protein [Cyanobacterium stanieri LEGE 03274]|uniref:YbjN domain-containing protein n=1 Tax=Cyanobacterium stanieri LEGE 03274 TaxID=1828756 RepID=A0ABR9V768_9CHRO|nr:YbjN domain-containing protein [Cyanobacterium stanieri]MBE9223751.1 YbjN domain-containing protein [Cyanobacterium stanieri LEGE 03274]
MTNADLMGEESTMEDNLMMDSYQVNHKDEIETVIYSLEENDSAMVLKNDDGYLWKFQYGSVEVFVQLTGESDDDLLTVWSVVLPLPAKNESMLMRKLLEMNWSGTFETCFSIFNEQIVVSAQRTIADLYPSEISRIITLVATIADDNDDDLLAEYGNS